MQMRTPFILFLVACSGGEDPDPTDGLDPTSAPDCASLWVDGLTEPDPDGPDTQIHGTSLFDGEHLWMAWNRPDGQGQFDIWMQRVGCDGAVDVGPFEVTATDDSELDPVLAVSGDRLLVAWSSDNGMGPANLDIRLRVYDLDGNAVTEPADLEPSRDGAELTGNVWLPSVAPREGGFWLAGSWGHEESPAFQAFAVALDLDGVPVEDGVDGEVDPVFGQTYASIREGGGEVQLVWQEDSVDSVEPALVGGVLEAPSALVTPGARPKLAHGSSGWWMAYDTGAGDVAVRTPGGDDVVIDGLPFHHSPSIVATDDGAVVLAMELLSGVSNALTIWQVDLDGQVVHTHGLETDSAVSVYGVDLTAVDDQHLLVVYQDGENPAYRLKAEWITLP